jgi:gas vesicle protein
MAIQEISSPLTSNSSAISLPGYNLTKADKGKGGVSLGASSGARLKTSISSEYYSSQKYAVEFTSKDGDKVSFSYESVEYSKTAMEINAKGSKEDFEKLGAFVKDQLKKMSSEIVKNFLKDAGIETGSSDEVDGADDAAAIIPEYWNAENTSQRVVDFAVSFFDAFKGNGDEFLSKIKAAIEDGFSQAKKAFGGDFPDGISKLISDTHDLIMKKLDSWAEKTISVEEKPATEIAA